MYCRKCGAQLTENARFCSRCGEGVTPPKTNPAGETARGNETDTIPAPDYPFYDPSAVKEKRQPRRLFCVFSALCSILAVALLFADWFAIHYSTIFQSGILRLTFFRVGYLGSLLQKVSGISSDLSLLPIYLTCVGLTVSVLLSLLGSVGAWCNRPRLGALGVTGNVLGFVLTLFLLIYTAVLGALLRSHIALLTGNVLLLTAAPYCMLPLFAAGFVFSLLLLRGSEKKTYLPPLLISTLGALAIMVLAFLIMIGVRLVFQNVAAPSSDPLFRESPDTGEYYYDFFGGDDDTGVLPR